jgi:hypothetical protein
MHPQKKKTKKETSPAHAVYALPPLQSKPSVPCTPVCDCVSPSCTQRRKAWKRRAGVAWRQFAAERSVWLLPLGGGRNSKDFSSQWIIVVNNRDINIDQNNRDNHFGDNRAALVRPQRGMEPAPTAGWVACTVHAAPASQRVSDPSPDSLLSWTPCVRSPWLPWCGPVRPSRRWCGGQSVASSPTAQEESWDGYQINNI